MTVVEKVERNAEEAQEQGCCFKFDNACCSLLGKWWNVRYEWQRRILRVIEQPIFHIVIIGLVLVDCLFVIAQIILDFIKFNKMCKSGRLNKTAAHNEHEDHGIELTIEVLHFSSLALLAVFVVEILVKVFVFGRHWWNYHDKKREWLDAIVVLASFTLDIVLTYKNSMFAEVSLLFISLRLWRLTRIINSVAQTIRSEDAAKKKQLAASYNKLIELLLIVSEKKSFAISNLDREMIPESYHNIIDEFEAIDQCCHTILRGCERTSSVNAVTEMARRLQDATEKFQLKPQTNSQLSDSKINN
ncbi:unnamed protein product [Rotaria sordida]|uniref:Voltage-gated hydrogen channel 1 n=1 Tax=Rotaria sordida TaxID=392033 RepID=A0A814WAD6_9BILA|nr:unnamed protein product [Rotaria sordida]CAF1258900.1 unnamed protein product [Rotaria sordida]